MLKGGLWKAADSEGDDSMRGFGGGLFRPGEEDSEEENSEEGSSEEGNSEEESSGEGNSEEESSGEENSEEGSSGEGNSEEESSEEGNSGEQSSGEEVPGKEIDGEEDSQDSRTETLLKDSQDALEKPDSGFSPVFALLLGIAAIAIFLMGLGLGRAWGKKKSGAGF